MGCHSGLSVPDSLISGTNTDWAQQIARSGGIYIANTGFGYGDTESVAYTEELMALFAEQATRSIEVNGLPTTVGQALMFAKNQYVAELGVLSVYDEKAVMESTFYGLPFYRTALPTVPAPAVPTNATAPDSTGTAASVYISEPSNNENDTGLAGTYYSNVDENGDEQVIVAPGRPIQPADVIDVSVVDLADTTELAERAHGAIVLDMTSEYLFEDNPVIATPIFNESARQPEPPVGDQTFPAKPLKLNTFTTPSGERQNLVVATGQYRSSTNTQRLDDDIDVLVYYSNSDRLHETDHPLGHVDRRERAGHDHPRCGRQQRHRRPGLRPVGGEPRHLRFARRLARARPLQHRREPLVGFAPAHRRH